MSAANINSHSISIFDKLIISLSIYTIVELYIGSVIDYNETIQYCTESLDFVICLIFLFDFFKRLTISRSKVRFIYSNWIDFVSSIPTVGVLRIGRVVRIIRVLRLVRSGRVFYRIINRDNAISTFRTVVIFIIILIIMSSLSIHHLEKNVNPFFETIYNSLWWCIITTVTLGFVQDAVPITVAGKLYSVFLIVLGMVLFGTFTGMVADYFISDEEIKDEIKNLNIKLTDIENKLDTLLKSKSNSKTGEL